MKVEKIVTKIFKIDSGFPELEGPPFEQIQVHTIVEFDIPAGVNGYCELGLDFDKVRSYFICYATTS